MTGEDEASRPGDGVLNRPVGVATDECTVTGFRNLPALSKEEQRKHRRVDLGLLAVRDRAGQTRALLGARLIAVATAPPSQRRPPRAPTLGRFAAVASA